MTSDAELARLLVLVADSVDHRGGTASSGIIRLAARRLVELEVLLQERGHAENGCHGCGAPLGRANTGRPRQWCGRGRCDRRTREKSTMESDD